MHIGPRMSPQFSKFLKPPFSNLLSAQESKREQSRKKKHMKNIWWTANLADHHLLTHQLTFDNWGHVQVQERFSLVGREQLEFFRILWHQTVDRVKNMDEGTQRQFRTARWTMLSFSLNDSLYPTTYHHLLKPWILEVVILWLEWKRGLSFRKGNHLEIAYELLFNRSRYYGHTCRVGDKKLCTFHSWSFWILQLIINS